jgi:hypothetical protein
LQQDSDSFGKMVLDDFHDGPSEKRSIDVQSPEDARDQILQDLLGIVHKIRKAMKDRDSQYQLAGLAEMDDAFIGFRELGPPGRGAKGKSQKGLIMSALS